MNIYSVTTLLFATFMTGLSHGLVIDNTGSQDGNIFRFGESNTATYGQTFTVGTENVLNSFTFYLDDHVNPDYVDFEAYIYAWDGSKASGSTLFSTGPLSTSNNAGLDGFEEFAINTGNLTLNSGSQYVAFFSSSNLFDGIQGTSNWASVSDNNSVTGGQFVYLNNGNNFSHITSQNWASWRQDLSHKMVFSSESDSSVAISEPSSVAFIAMGILGLAGWRRRHQSKA